MTANLKVISSIVGVTTGVCGIVALSLWQSGKLSTNALTETSPSNSSSFSVSVPDQSDNSTTIESAKKGNCKVVDSLEEGIFKGLGIRKDDYTTIYCEDTNLENSDIKLSKGWTGLFPNELLVSYGELQLNKGFDLKTDTELNDDDSDENYKTTFTGSEFLDSSVIGTWGSEDKVLSGKSITVFNIVNESGTSDKIYLLLPKKER